MADAADIAADSEVRAMEAFERERLQRIAESHRPYVADPDRPCCDCGAPIGAARLEAMPATGRCTPCASAIEGRGFV